MERDEGLATCAGHSSVLFFNDTTRRLQKRSTVTARPLNFSGTRRACVREERLSPLFLLLGFWGGVNKLARLFLSELSLLKSPQQIEREHNWDVVKRGGV
jgi:hypothetical protein